MINQNEPDFLYKLDQTSLARFVRLAYIKSCVRQGLIKESDAIELLKGCLTPEDQTTKYDDSRWLNWEKDKRGESGK